MALLCSVALLPSVSAWSEERSETVAADKYYAYPIHLQLKSHITIDIDCTAGPNVDVYLVNQENYTIYADHKITHEGSVTYTEQRSFQYITDGSGLDTDRISDSFYLDAGDYFLVIDNTPIGEADPGTSSVTVYIDVQADAVSSEQPTNPETTSSNDDGWVVFVLTIALTALITGGVVWFILKKY